jgi:predicted dehydrogenase
LGVAGLRHAAAAAKAGVALVGAVDPSPSAARAAEALGLPCYPRLDQLLDEGGPEAVVISLPHALLSDAAVTCARRGLHVLLEKPMGTTLDQADAVIAAARAAGVALMVNFVHRFREEYRQAKALIAAGAIGRPVLIVDSMSSGHSEMPAWVWDRAVSGGGMMMYNGVHSIDRLAWLAGDSAARVSASAGTFCHPVEVEDTLAGVVTFRQGTLGVVIQHKSDAAVTLGGWDTTVWGTRGAIRVGGGALEIASDKERAKTAVQEDDRFLGAMREFIEAIRERRDPVPGGEDGRQALATVLALYESAANGRATELFVNMPRGGD